MAYLVKIDLSKLKPAEKKAFNKLIDDDRLDSQVAKRGDQAVIIKPPLFDYLEYEFFTNKMFKRKVKFTLLKQTKGKVKVIVNNCKLKSDEFNEILRTLRF